MTDTLTDKTQRLETEVKNAKQGHRSDVDSFDKERKQLEAKLSKVNLTGSLIFELYDLRPLLLCPIKSDRTFLTHRELVWVCAQNDVQLLIDFFYLD